MIQNIQDIKSNDLCILGIPFDENSSFRKGASLAPDRIRESYFSDSSNLWTETGIDLGAEMSLIDLGDMSFQESNDAFSSIENKITQIIKKDARLVTLGGDHSITYPIIKSYAKQYKKINLLHFDAHPDLYDELSNNKYSHACPFARIMEEHLVSKLVQVGIRCMTGHLREQSEKFGADIMEMKNINQWPASLEFDGPLYISIDLDCLDPAFAPGVSHHEPGGMTTRHVIDIIHGLQAHIVGVDIVEYNPERDFMSMTSMVAAKLLKEILGRMLRN